MPHKKVIEDGYSIKDAAFLVGVNYQAAANVIKMLKNTVVILKNVENIFKKFWLS